MREVPSFHLKQEIDLLWEPIMEAVQRVLASGRFILGQNVAALEKEIAQYIGVRYAVGVNSGTDALMIALKSAGIKEGDEVITSPFSFFATAEAIHQVGAIPVFADIDPITFNLDADAVERAISSKTSAIVPVHLFGHAANMQPILDLARDNNLKVIEDTAQAFGGEYEGKKLGSLGDAGCFSFFPSKNLGAYGDGGLIVTNDDNIYESARMLRTHGSKQKYNNEQLGYNSRLDELQAAILRVKLPYVEEWNTNRINAAAYYDHLLKGIPQLVLPSCSKQVKHVYHQYTVRVKGGKRNGLQQRLKKIGIETVVYYPKPIHLLPLYRGLKGSFYEAERAASEVLSLPLWPQMQEDVQERVARAIKEILK